ncbi:MAG: hypothetical protein LBJ10_05090 [Clostridiales bacterium]|jgi:hypothetical protein|nr:hypothetical protein [Clostridiales bacterium]
MNEYERLSLIIASAAALIALLEYLQNRKKQVHVAFSECLWYAIIKYQRS